VTKVNPRTSILWPGARMWCVFYKRAVELADNRVRKPSDNDWPEKHIAKTPCRSGLSHWVKGTSISVRSCGKCCGGHCATDNASVVCNMKLFLTKNTDSCGTVCAETIHEKLTCPRHVNWLLSGGGQL